jgi:hypothetical protein
LCTGGRFFARAAGAIRAGTLRRIAAGLPLSASSHSFRAPRACANRHSRAELDAPSYNDTGSFLKVLH